MKVIILGNLLLSALDYLPAESSRFLGALAGYPQLSTRHLDRIRGTSVNLGPLHH